MNEILVDQTGEEVKNQTARTAGARKQKVEHRIETMSIYGGREDKGKEPSGDTLRLFPYSVYTLPINIPFSPSCLSLFAPLGLSWHGRRN